MFRSFRTVYSYCHKDIKNSLHRPNEVLSLMLRFKFVLLQPWPKKFLSCHVTESHGLLLLWPHIQLQQSQEWRKSILPHTREIDKKKVDGHNFPGIAVEFKWKFIPTSNYNNWPYLYNNIKILSDSTYHGRRVQNSYFSADFTQSQVQVILTNKAHANNDC